MKSSRQEKILELIKRYDIETQNQLIDALRNEGVKSTQTTVSRDIKELRLVKELAENGSYRYVAPRKEETANNNERLKTIFKEGVKSFDHAQNIVVLKTLPGLASAACSALDSMHMEGMVGTIAGDDTAFIAMKDNQTAERLCEDIELML